MSSSLAPAAAPGSIALVTDALTPRAIVCTISIGSILCLMNMYFGLQAGIANGMPMQTALLRYAIFNAFRKHLPDPLTPIETTVIEIIAGAIGLALFTSGVTSFIPALEFLTIPAENGATRFSLGQLLLWSFSICGLGLIVGVPFRTLFILRERLRYPSAIAIGTLIGVLFRRSEITARGEPSKRLQYYLSLPQPQVLQ
jgi:uncharacterized oligopeptide transporter (OPT) family protein